MSGCGLEPEETEELWTSEVNYDLGEKLLFIDFNKEAELRQSTHIRAGQTTASKLAESHAQAKPKKSFEEIVPEEYHKFKETVFGKESFDELPPRRPWDHAIELVPGAKLQDCK
ncbi:hypothetical protein H0H81_011138, partial [Sphagnurus paluster]